MSRALTPDTLRASPARNLRRIPRNPDLLTAYTVQPVMFSLLFVYVFGGAISTPGYDYIDFLIPGIIVQQISFGGFATALGLADDLQKGLVDRFRSLPMSRMAVLTGRTLSDIAMNALALTMMSSSATSSASASRPRLPRWSPGSCSAADRLRVLVGLRLRRAVRLHAGDRERVRLHRDLPAHVRLLGLRAAGDDAGGLQTFANANPFSTMVDAVRSLWVGAPAGNDVWGAVVWCVGLIAFFAPFAVFSVPPRGRAVGGRDGRDLVGQQREHDRVLAALLADDVAAQHALARVAGALGDALRRLVARERGQVQAPEPELADRPGREQP